MAKLNPENFQWVQKSGEPSLICDLTEAEAKLALCQCIRQLEKLQEQIWRVKAGMDKFIQGHV